MGMKSYYFLLFIALWAIACNEKSTERGAKNLINIIPYPNKVMEGKGSYSFENIRYFISEEFGSLSNVIPTLLNGAVKVEDKGQSSVRLLVNKNLAEEEYRLEVNQSGVTVEAKSSVGALYGLQSLRQLIPLNGSKVIPFVTIEDKPRFQYRGMHLDVGRHFFNIDFIKKYIDLLSMYKINNFHWHLTEDQGWRIEIKKYPKLTQIAAFRNETLIGHYNDLPQKFDGKRYGGFYTQDEIKDVVKYATERNINIIPEIEMPGHAQAAIAAYPELGCTGRQLQVATKWGVFDDVFCPNQQTFQFLEDVLLEVMALFPSKYIHIGGDECPKTQWINSPFCQALIKKEGLKDEHGLQSYFIQRMEKFINSKGRQIIGWDEILEGGLAPNATVMSWRGIEGGKEAAKQKHNVIMTPTDYCYFDYYQSKSAKEPLAIGGFLPLQKVYSYDPIPSTLSKEESIYIIGTQGNLWTEYLSSPEKVEYMVLPRMQAMAEIGWTLIENKSYEGFVKRLNHHFDLWKKLGYNYADKSKELVIKINAGQGNGVSVDLATNGSALPVRYSINGALSNQSPIAKNPIKIEKSCELLASTFDNNSSNGVDTIQFTLHKAAGKKITLAKLPSEKYASNGPGSLVNGVSGSATKFGNEWLGFEGEDMDALIDLGEIIPIDEIKTRFFNGPGQWIYPPKSVSVFFSQDNKNFNEMPAFLVRPSDNSVIDFSVPAASTKARYIKIKAENYGIIPASLQGGGHPAWLMVDELFIN